MKIRTLATYGVLTGVIVTSVGLMASSTFAIAADNSVYVGSDADSRKADQFIDALSDTRATGHYDVLPDGTLLVRTEGTASTDKVAEYIATDRKLADVAEPSLTWYATPGVGSNVQPGFQLIVDFDNDGKTDGILVGEPVYEDGTALYGNDWWLSNGSAQAVKDKAPSHTGGFGSTNHGTLDQWRAAFPDANVDAFGFSLGSGVFNSGQIAKLSIGTDTYRFTSTAPVIPTEPEPSTQPEPTDTAVAVPVPNNATPVKAELAATGTNDVQLAGLAVVGAGLLFVGAILVPIRLRQAKHRA